MAFEVILLLLLAGGSLFFVGIPLAKFIKSVLPKDQNSLKEAHERLEKARVEMEVAKINKETEKVYQHLYEDVLQEDDDLNEEENQNRSKLG